MCAWWGIVGVVGSHLWCWWCLWWGGGAPIVSGRMLRPGAKSKAYSRMFVLRVTSHMLHRSIAWSWWCCRQPSHCQRQLSAIIHCSGIVVVPQSASCPGMPLHQPGRCGRAIPRCPRVVRQDLWCGLRFDVCRGLRCF